MSMGSIGDCYDAAMCESFNATLDANFSRVIKSKRKPKRRSLYSTSSRAGIIHTGGTRRSATSRPLTLNVA